MRRICGLVVLLFGVANSNAQGVTGPNQLGVFFDESGTINSIYEQEIDEIAAYLLLLNPTESGDIVQWTAAVYMNIFTPTETPSWLLGEPRFGVNSWVSGPGANIVQGFVVDISPSSPQPITDVTVLADLRILPLGDDGVKRFYVVGETNHYVTTGGTLIIMNPASGDQYSPVAAINAESPVGETRASWGSIKAIFQ